MFAENLPASGGVAVQHDVHQHVLLRAADAEVADKDDKADAVVFFGGDDALGVAHGRIVGVGEYGAEQVAVLRVVVAQRGAVGLDLHHLQIGASRVSMVSGSRRLTASVRRWITASSF